MKTTKSLLLILVLSIFTASFLCAQDSGGISGSEPGLPEILPEYLIHANSSSFGALDFQFADGRPVYAEALEELLDIPVNKPVLKQMKRNFIGMHIFNAISLAAAIGFIVYACADDDLLPYSDVIMPSLFLGALGANIGTRINANAYAVNTLRAVDNYNLSIMGVKF